MSSPLLRQLFLVSIALSMCACGGGSGGGDSEIDVSGRWYAWVDRDTWQATDTELMLSQANGRVSGFFVTGGDDFSSVRGEVDGESLNLFLERKAFTCNVPGTPLTPPRTFITNPTHFFSTEIQSNDFYGGDFFSAGMSVADDPCNAFAGLKLVLARSNRPGPPPPPRFGQFIDSPVEGIGVLSATFSGLTDGEGKFPHNSGDDVSFSIGDIDLGSINAFPGLTVTPMHLMQGVTRLYPPYLPPVEDSTINMLRFLQSLDENSQPADGIFVSPATSALAAGQSLDFGLSPGDFALQANPLLTHLTAGRVNSLIDADDALAHFVQTIGNQTVLPAVESGAIFNAGVFDSFTAISQLRNSTTTGNYYYALEIDLDEIPVDARGQIDTIGLFVSVSAIAASGKVEVHQYVGNGTLEASDFTETSLVADFSACPNIPFYCSINPSGTVDLTAIVQTMYTNGDRYLGLAFRQDPTQVDTGALLSISGFNKPGLEISITYH